MDPQGYAIVLGYNNQFVLRFYSDCNKEDIWIDVIHSYSYDEIMRTLLADRVNRGMGKEYWIS